MKISVVDAGAMGTSIAIILAKAGHDVILTIQPFDYPHIELFSELYRTGKNRFGKRENHLGLRGIELPANMDFTDNFKFENNPNAIFMAVPTKFLLPVYQKIREYVLIHPKCTLVLLSKGLDENSISWSVRIKNDMTLCGRKNFAVLYGYTPASELAVSDLTWKTFAASLASRDLNAIKKIRKVFSGTQLGIVGTTDIRGTGIGSALTKAYAIGYGLLLGLSQDSSAFPFLEKAHNEMKVFLDNAGASPKTLQSPAVRGDFYGTCQGEIAWESRNVAFGKFLAKYPSAFEAIKYVSENTVEGYEALKTFHQIAHENKLRAPILYAIHRVCFYSASPTAMLEYLIPPS